MQKPAFSGLRDAHGFAGESHLQVNSHRTAADELAPAAPKRERDGSNGIPRGVDAWRALYKIVRARQRRARTIRCGKDSTFSV